MRTLSLIASVNIYKKMIARYAITGNSRIDTTPLGQNVVDPISYNWLLWTWKRTRKQEAQNGQVVERYHQTWRLTPVTLFPSSAHEFYTFSMGGLDFPERCRRLCTFPLLSCTYTYTYSHTHTRTCASGTRRHTRIHTDTHYAQRRNCIFRGSRNAIRGSLTLCNISESKCVYMRHTHNVILLQS